MIAWDTICPVVLELMHQLSGLETVWQDQPQGYMSRASSFGDIPGATCKLSIGPATGKGRDEIRTAYDPSQAKGQELQDSVTGVRHFTLKVLVECLDQTDGKTAYQYLERVRGRLRFRSSREALNSVNCAFVGTADVIDLSMVRDGRQWSIANLDVRLACAALDTDESRRGYIDTVQTSGILNK